ncbi:MAG: futalosine hydrolase [Desulfuromonadales bacterium]|nr:futalosine hydrolase [Desulfuromonadales bacterium]
MILLLAAAPLETTLLRRKISVQQETLCGQHKIFRGLLCGHDITVAHGGIGQTNMAIQLTQLVSQLTPNNVFLFGCGGSYPGSGLNIGDLVLASRETYADLGVETASGFVALEELNLPADKLIAPAVQQQFTMHPDLLAWARECLPSALVGPCLTVNCCSGTPELSRALEKRWQGICENMEGAAAAQVCEQFAIPLLELRGISNPTGTRDPAQWNLRLGADNAQLGILELLESWPTP